MHKDIFQAMTQRNTQGLWLPGHYVGELLQHCSHSHAFNCSLQKDASMYVHMYIHTHLDYTKEISMHWHSALVNEQPTTYTSDCCIVTDSLGPLSRGTQSIVVFLSLGGRHSAIHLSQLNQHRDSHLLHIADWGGLKHLG